MQGYIAGHQRRGNLSWHIPSIVLQGHLLVLSKNSIKYPNISRETLLHASEATDPLASLVKMVTVTVKI